MAGLLDFVNTPEGQGLLSAAFGGLAGARRGTPLNNLGRAGLSGLSGFVDANDRVTQQAALTKRNQLFDLQLQQAQQAQADMAARRKLAADSAMTPNQVAMNANGGPTVAAGLAAQTTEPGYNWNRLATGLAALGDYQGALAIQQSLRKEQPKLSKLETMRTPDGQIANVAVFEDGTTKVLPFGVKPEIVMQQLGDRVEAVDKNAVQGGQSFKMGQSPDSVASNAVGWANVKNSRERLKLDQAQADTAVTYQTDADGNFVALPTKVKPGAIVRAAPVVASNGLSPLKGKGAGLTEDQGKATGWLVQANNAFKNMQAAMESTPGAENPGLNDGLAAIPSFGLTTALANTMRGKDRQKFMQGASSLSEALLRAATGAGVNQDEAVQKVREITPVFGDDDETVKQKMAAIPLYIESLKVRAGPGANKALAIGNEPFDFASAARAEMARRRDALKGK